MNSQESKSAAAASYDYENDPRWADYWGNVLIPPNMAARPDVVNHFKRKFYQRFIDPELVVEPISTSSTSQTTRPSTSNPSNQTRQQTSESTTRASGTYVSPASLRWDRQTIQFSLNAWVFVVAVLAVFPLSPQNLSNRAYRLSLTGTASTISMLSSQAEIGIGFLLIVSLVSWQRNIIQTFMYWQLLKLMYHAPVTASYHQSMWAQIGRIVNPLVASYAPFLSTPISTIQRWWLR
uniref:Uncharacterized protein n=1 Tax=Daucus carota subsp. sativus TaxID=79200 RepID=A0A162AK22_DAUCS